MPCAPIPHGMLCAPLIHGVEVAVHVEDPITKRGALKRAPRFAYELEARFLRRASGA